MGSKALLITIVSNPSKTDAMQPDSRLTDRWVTLFQRWPTPPPTITEAALVVVTRWLELADAALVHPESAKPRHRRVASAFFDANEGCRGHNNIHHNYVRLDLSYAVHSESGTTFVASGVVAYVTGDDLGVEFRMVKSI